MPEKKRARCVIHIPDNHIQIQNAVILAVDENLLGIGMAVLKIPHGSVENIDGLEHERILLRQRESRENKGGSLLRLGIL